MNGDIHSVPLSFCIQLRYDSQKDKGTLTKGVCIQLRYDSLSRCLSSSLVANGDIQTKGQFFCTKSFCRKTKKAERVFLQKDKERLSAERLVPLSKCPHSQRERKSFFERQRKQKDTGTELSHSEWGKQSLSRCLSHFDGDKGWRCWLRMRRFFVWMYVCVYICICICICINICVCVCVYLYIYIYM